MSLHYASTITQTIPILIQQGHVGIVVMLMSLLLPPFDVPLLTAGGAAQSDPGFTC